MPRPRMIEISNTVLADRIAETGLPYTKIANRINDVADENGLPAHYNAGSVSHWLTGRTPKPNRIPVIVEAFRRLLGTPHLRAHDLGWKEPAAAVGDPAEGGPGESDPWRADPCAWLVHLGRLDMTQPDRRFVLFSLTAATLPAAFAEMLGATAVSSRKAGAADATRIREMTKVFSDMDDRFGGGHARVSVAAYLTGHVTPMLRNASNRSQPALFAAAAELAYLAGFMASDAGNAGLAQRYYIQAVRLGIRAEDYRIQAAIIRAMALQAVELGHAEHGLALSDAAARALPRAAPPRLRSWITAMRAEAAATAGCPREARTLLRNAERDLDSASSSHTQDWTGSTYSHVALWHQTGTTLASCGDLEPAEEHLMVSLTRRPTTQRRSRALIGARLALLQARRHNPSAAARTIQGIASDLQMVESARVAQELRTLRITWRRARTEPAVEAADQAVADLLRERNRRRTA